MSRQALHGVAAVLLLATAAASARDRPAAPSQLRAEARQPTTVHLRWTNNTSRDEVVKFEIEQTTNGVRLPHWDEARLSAAAGLSGSGSGWTHFSGTRVLNLTPQTEYCFRLWARVVKTGVRSAGPSEWACTVTPPHPPLAPLDVKAVLTSPAHNAPRVSWNTPDQSGWRGIDRYIVEHQSPPVAGRPWVTEKTLTGPRGAQTAAARLVYATATSVVDPKQEHLYRVCAENAGGRTCAAPVGLGRARPADVPSTSDVARIAPPQSTQQPATSTAGSGGTGMVSAAQRMQAALEAQRAQQQGLQGGAASESRPDPNAGTVSKGGGNAGAGSSIARTAPTTGPTTARPSALGTTSKATSVVQPRDITAPKSIDSAFQRPSAP